MKHKWLRNMVLIASIVGLSWAVTYSVHNPQPKESPPANLIKPAAAPEMKPTVKTIPRNTNLKEPNTPVETKATTTAPKPNTEAQPVTTAPSPPAVVTKPFEAPPVSRSTTHTYSSNTSYPLLSNVQGSFGQFHYRDTSGGRIEIAPQWINDNIVTIVLPGLNRSVQVHKAAADNFIAAFNYIKNGSAIINGREVSLLSLIKTMDGTFVTRHVNWNPSRGLSNHSWGIAIDINAADHFRYINPTSEPDDPNLILWEKAFKPAGFSWGNRYADSMHFELLN